ncbi:MAG: exodeoxyribonuclease VII large subunit [Opitutaceae bacterium]
MLDNCLQPAPEQVLKVTELTHQIKRLLEGSFRQVWVLGEVSNLRRQSSGHVYFSLKDAGSQIPCVLFARDAAAQSFQLEDGMELQLFGDLSVYAPHGRYQLIAKIAIRSGEGRLQLEFERVKRKLAAEGLFEPSAKKTLPTLPLRIAVITSPTGAAIRDFLRILRRRNYGGEVVIFPARVQGTGAAEEIRAMLKHATASPGFDLIVMTRGGGSIEDLWAFNEETLARTVAECPLPTISAVGHEIDNVLTDYAADLRAETPSAAAELISSLYIKAQQALEVLQNDLAYYAEDTIATRARALKDLQARMRIIAPDRQVELQSMRLDEMENRLTRHLREQLLRNKSVIDSCAQKLAEHHPRTKFQLASQTLKNCAHQLQQSVDAKARRKHEHLAHLRTRLENGSLNATLKRGYTFLKDSEGTIMDSAITANARKQLTAHFHDGTVEVNVKE